MAKSNWATLAFNHEGKPIDGIMDFNGIEVEIYKNWIYVRDEQAYRSDDTGFTGTTIMDIHQGDFTYQRIKFLVVRYPIQNAVFAVIQRGYWHNREEKPFQAMLGIGCYGYDDSEWVGVTPELKEAFFRWLNGAHDHSLYHSGLRDPSSELINLLPIDTESFNQGTMYLMEHFYKFDSVEDKIQATQDIDKLATEDGEPKNVLLGAMIKNLFKEDIENGSENKN